MSIDYTRVHGVTLLQAHEADELTPSEPVLRVQVIKDRVFLTVEEQVESGEITTIRRLSQVGVNLSSLKSVLGFSQGQSDAELQRIMNQETVGDINTTDEYEDGRF